ncbi:MAG: glycoside hydrolase family 28 protein [Saprospiraceae bacterium]|nr:glycoside hydrolase family 28 protein [Saprospiraceae bacterium]
MSKVTGLIKNGGWFGNGNDSPHGHPLRGIFLLGLAVCSLATLSARDHNILEHGAIADGKTLNTRVIQATIDQVFREGGGRVIVPAGRFLTGSLWLKSGINLHLLEGAVLLGSTNPDHYQKVDRWKALLFVDHQENIRISGKGEINGQGRSLALNIDSLFYAGQLDSSDYNFVEMRPKYYLRPLLLYFYQCKNINVRGITLRDASCWVQDYNLCEDVVIDSVVVESDAYWNNDGIDISDCKRVQITNCHVNSADDGICLKSHFEDGGCDSVYIAHCTVRSSASAVKLGTRSSGGFKNVTIRDITVYDTYRSAIAIENVDGGRVENVRVENLVATNTGNAIFIRLGWRYQNRPAGVLRNITLKNIQVEVPFGRPDGDYDLRGPDLPFFHNTFPSSITGIPGQKIENVTLENVIIKYPGRGNNGLANSPLSRLDRVPENIQAYPEFSMFGELPAWGFYIRHVDGLTMKAISVHAADADYRPALVLDDVDRLSLNQLQTPGVGRRYQAVLRHVTIRNIDPSIDYIKY